MTPAKIVLRDGVAVPYSKGLTAQAIMASGVAPARSYALAILIEERLPSGCVSVEELHALTEQVLADHDGPRALARYRSWQALGRLDRPLVVLIGGTAGTGKSTLATGLAHRLGITRLTSTDTIRHILRTCFSADVMPHVHLSSFEARRAVGVLTVAGQDADLLGFDVQAQHVGAAVRAIVARAIEERTPLILEGVHLVPGVLGDLLALRALVVHVMLEVSDEAAHRGHFEVRGELQSRGPVDRYLQGMPIIRKLQDHLVSRARAEGVRVVPVGSPDQVLSDVLEVVLEAVAAVPGEGDADMLAA